MNKYMYTLRIIEETRKEKNAPFEQVIENFALGNSYSVLRKGSTSEFEETLNVEYPEEKPSGIRALLCAENGHKFFIMEPTEFLNYGYFIMTENGTTFERI